MPRHNPAISTRRNLWCPKGCGKQVVGIGRGMHAKFHCMKCGKEFKRNQLEPKHAACNTRPMGKFINQIKTKRGNENGRKKRI